MAGIWITIVISKHTAKHKLRIDLMSHGNCKCTCYQLMMHCLITALLTYILRVQHSCTEYRTKVLRQHIDLIESQPIFYLTFISLK